MIKKLLCLTLIFVFGGLIKADDPTPQEYYAQATMSLQLLDSILVGKNNMLTRDNMIFNQMVIAAGQYQWTDDEWTQLVGYGDKFTFGYNMAKKAYDNAYYYSIQAYNSLKDADVALGNNELQKAVDLTKTAIDQMASAQSYFGDINIGISSETYYLDLYAELVMSKGP